MKIGIQKALKNSLDYEKDIEDRVYGEIRPVDTNMTIEGRYNNRRVIARVNVTK